MVASSTWSSFLTHHQALCATWWWMPHGHTKCHCKPEGHNDKEQGRSEHQVGDMEERGKGCTCEHQHTPKAWKACKDQLNYM
jgi:hypothetical protein